MTTPTFTLKIDGTPVDYENLKIEWDSEGGSIHSWSATLADVSESVSQEDSVEIERNGVSCFKGVVEVINPEMDEGGARKTVSGRHTKIKIWRKWVEKYTKDVNWKSCYPNKIVEFLLHRPKSDLPTLDLGTYQRMGYGLVTVDDDNNPIWTVTTNIGPATGETRVTDRLEQNEWVSNKAQTDGDWIKIDLGSARDISGIRVDNRSLQPWDYIRNYKIETSTDDSSYTERASVTRNKAINIIESWTAVSARYIKITCTADWGGYWWRISNIYVYESDGDISGISIGTLTEHLPFNVSLLDSDAASGQKEIVVKEGWRFQEGDYVIVGDDNNEEGMGPGPGIDASVHRTIASVSGDTITLDQDLDNTYETTENAFLLSYDREAEVEMPYSRLDEAINSIVTLCTTDDIKWQWEVTDDGAVNMGSRIGSDVSGTVSFVYQTHIVKDSNKQDNRKKVDRILVLGKGGEDERDRMSSGWVSSGGTDDYELIYTDNSLETREACITKAKTLLNEWSTPVEVIVTVDDKYTTGTWGIGDDVTLTNSLTGLSGSYTVKKISRVYSSSGEGVIINASHRTSNLSDILSTLAKKERKDDLSTPTTPHPYGFEIFRESNRYYARDGRTGSKAYESSSANDTFKWVVNVMPEGEVYIHPGTYRDLAVSVQDKRISFRGAGKRQTILVPAAGSYAITMEYTTVKGALQYPGHIRDLSVYGMDTDDPTSGNGILWRRVSRGSINSIEVRVKGDYGIKIEGGKGPRVTDVTAEVTGGVCFMSSGIGHDVDDEQFTAAVGSPVQLKYNGVVYGDSRDNTQWIVQGSAVVTNLAGTVTYTEGADKHYTIQETAGTITATGLAYDPNGGEIPAMSNGTSYLISYTWDEDAVDHVYTNCECTLSDTGFYLGRSANGFQLVNCEAGSMDSFCFRFRENWSGGWANQIIATDSPDAIGVEIKGVDWYSHSVQINNSWISGCLYGLHIKGESYNGRVDDLQITNTVVQHNLSTGILIEDWVHYPKINVNCSRNNEGLQSEPYDCNILIANGPQQVIIYDSYLGYAAESAVLGVNPCLDNLTDPPTAITCTRPVKIYGSDPYAVQDTIVNIQNCVLQMITTAAAKIWIENLNTTYAIYCYHQAIRSEGLGLNNFLEKSEDSTGTIIHSEVSHIQVVDAFPLTPREGQHVFHTGFNQYFMYDSDTELPNVGGWVPLTRVVHSGTSTERVNAGNNGLVAPGDFWWDTTDEAMYHYTPSYTWVYMGSRDYLIRDNWLLNPDFEDISEGVQNTDDSYRPDSWTYDDVTGDGQIEQITTDAVSGVSCLKITTEQSWAVQGVYTNKYFAVDPSREMYWEMWVKAENANNGDVTVVFYGYTKNPTTGIYTNVGNHTPLDNANGTTSWVQHTGRFTPSTDIHASTEYIRMCLYCESPTQSNSYVLFDSGILKYVVTTEHITTEPIVGKDFRTTDGTVIMNDTGLVVRGQYAVFQDPNAVPRGYIFGRAAPNLDFYITATGVIRIAPAVGSNLQLVTSGADITFTGDFVPTADSTHSIGSDNYFVDEIFVDDLYLQNNKNIYWRDSGGTSRAIMQYSSGDDLWIWSVGGDLHLNEDESGTIYFHGASGANYSGTLATTGVLNLRSTGELQIGSTKVVDSQQAAIADVAAGAADSDGTVRAKVNAILAMLRTHGLINT